MIRRGRASSGIVSELIYAWRLEVEFMNRTMAVLQEGAVRVLHPLDYHS